MPVSDPDQARRIVAQHAATARLLGAESVPMHPSADATVRTHASGSEIEPKTMTEAELGPKVDADRSRDEVQKQLDALRAKYEADAPHESFNTEFKNIVWGDGDPCARLMFIGEAPGADEDETGKPFVGKAGGLLNKMITAMGTSRDEVYIANVLKTRPPGNATPTIDEMRLCAPYLYEQIKIIDPEVIVTLGKPAVYCLLDRSEALGKLRGKWHEFPPSDSLSAPTGFERPIPVMPTYHPAYLLRSYTEDNRKVVWSDLKQVMMKLGLKPKK